jgi:hypothetical protein
MSIMNSFINDIIERVCLEPSKSSMSIMNSFINDTDISRSQPTRCATQL